MSNRLSHESSPYLLQHADNPVDWYPWGPEALDRARDEDRPILLSVGYSACHWCHVMERESFEDPAIAARMNRSFVNIKVDREERPDLDQIYMKAVQAMTGRGGWPMTVFLTPGCVPFFGGTYYPPEPRPGMPSFPQILDAVDEAWHDRRDEVTAGSARLLDALTRATSARSETGAGVEILERARQALSNQYDATHGGFGRAPKFPQPMTLEFLMHEYVRSDRAGPLEMAVHTLRRMAAGGMRDHLGGGFHRYSVDARWLVPHFEKMLYDNALLASAYVDAYRLTDSDDLLDVGIDTLEYILSDLRSPGGGFFSSRDADSEGEEGAFYLWSKDEIVEVLGPEEAGRFARTYDVSEAGNFEGRNILHLPRDLATLAAAEGLGESDLESRLGTSRRMLLDRRSTREAPLRDEKVIVSWNGLAIRAFAEAGGLTGRADFLGAARDAASFILEEIGSAEHGLLHSWIAGDARIPAFLDDHASLGNALLSLHGATLERRWLDAALAICDIVMDRFWDEGEGTVFDTATGTESLIVRPRDPMDNATPSGPSLAAELLARAGRITDDSRWLEAARRIVDREADALLRFGPGFGRMLSVLDRLESGSMEVAVFGGEDAETRALVRAVHVEFLPGAVVAGRLDGEVAVASPLFEGRGRIDGDPAVYVCRDHACELPLTEPAAVVARLRDA